MSELISIFDRSAGAGAEGWPIVRFQPIDFGREPIVLQPGEDWIAGQWDGGAYHIDPATGQPVAHAAMAVTAGYNLVSGIPAGTKARVGIASAGVIDDGSLELEADYPEVVAVTLTHPLYLPWEGQVSCGPV